jgi:hypothetical protein
MKYEQSHPLFSTGRIGLMTQGNRARFRHIRVTDPEGKVLFEGLPRVDYAPGTPGGLPARGEKKVPGTVDRIRKA